MRPTPCREEPLEQRERVQPDQQRVACQRAADHQPQEQAPQVRVPRKAAGGASVPAAGPLGGQPGGAEPPAEPATAPKGQQQEGQAPPPGAPAARGARAVRPLSKGPRAGTIPAREASAGRCKAHTAAARKKARRQTMRGGSGSLMR